MKYLLLLALLATQTIAFANEDGAFLDKPYKNLRHPKVDEVRDVLNLAAKNNTLAVIAKQSAVKSQMNRGTCSIFSATALLESLLVINKVAKDTRVDLSEEWLQYLISQTTTEEGSTSPDNFRALKQYGQPSETAMPYIGDSWEEARNDEANRRCGHLKASRLQQCLVAHRDPALLKASEEDLTNPNATTYDPEFLAARKEAFANRQRFFHGSTTGGSGYLTNTNQIKAQLDKGIPLALDIDFYYGAWNHREAEGLGINRDIKLWNKGFVSYPEKGSADREYSLNDPAGHSVVVVGYDDNATITFDAKMLDGSTKKFTRKGVYYIKNSWGTAGFGSEFTLGGKKFPGYGAISQDYAHEFGQFFQLHGVGRGSSN